MQGRILYMSMCKDHVHVAVIIKLRVQLLIWPFSNIIDPVSWHQGYYEGRGTIIELAMQCYNQDDQSEKRKGLGLFWAGSVKLAMQYRFFFFQGTKAIMKDVARYLPGIGWTFLFMEYPFLKRNWAQDETSLIESCRNLRDYPVKMLVSGEHAEKQTLPCNYTENIHVYTDHIQQPTI